MRKALRFVPRRVRATVLSIVALCVFLSGELGLTSSPKESDTRGKLRKVALFDLDTFDVNRIFNYLENDGTIVTDDNPVGVGTEWPKGSGRHINYASGFWLGGVVGQDTVTAAAEYVSEFVPGSVDFNPATPATPGTPKDKNDLSQQIYKINKSDLANPLANPDYGSWPFSEGAPYKDLNGNGAYDAGEPPLILGDQTIWYACNDFDAGAHANVFGSKTMGVELQTTIWGYNRPDAFGDMMFVKFLIINEGGKTIQNSYAAAWADIDLGDANDDYVGCDTTLGLGFNWNDGDDGDYGVAAPAIGYDFFQGPVVPGAPTDTAKAFGRRIPGKKNLKMTAFAKYIRGGGNDFGDPETAVEAYSYMVGLNRVGKPLIDPTTSQPSKFAHPGDPITGTGWIDPMSHPASDRRFLMSSGPFTLAPGDSQEVVIGMLIAQGADAKNSVALLKLYDRLAQLAYDIDFSLPPSPPAPNVKVAALPGEIVLSWDDAAESYIAQDLVDVDTAGLPTQYIFQGYNVYQINSENLGPGVGIKRLATFDIADGITAIKDVVFDEQRGEDVTVTVQHGEDSGLKRFARITADAFAANAPLSNWRKYYFAVSAYGYNPFGIPRTLESTPTPITIMPGTAPMIDTQYPHSFGDTLQVTRTAGSSDGSAVAMVVDPTRTTGHDYEVSFETDPAGEVFWNLTDVTANKVLLPDQTNQSGNDEYLIADGVLVKVIGPPPGVKEYSIPAGTRWWTWAGGADGFALEGFNGAIGWGATYPFDESTLQANQIRNVRLKFAGTDTDGNLLDANDPDASYAYRYLRGASAAPAKPEFEPFMVNRAGNYSFQDFKKNFPFAAYDDETGQRLSVGYLENNVTGGLVDGKYWPPDYNVGNNTATSGPREWFWIFDIPYGEAPDPFLGSPTTTMLGGGGPKPIMIWGTVARRGNVAANAADEFLILVNHVNSAADKFSFSTIAPIKGDVSAAKANRNLINVFPNPYFGQNLEERDPLNRYVTFTHLPAEAKIRIFTLAGDVVRTIDHRNGLAFERWDLRNQDGIPVASGIYIVYIDLGDIGQKILKVAVMIPEERLDVF